LSGTGTLVTNRARVSASGYTAGSFLTAASRSGSDAALPFGYMDHASEGSEANQIIASFRSLSAADQQDLVNFLRSL
jgi:hypothetical protein